MARGNKNAGVLVLDSKRSGNISTDIVWIHLDTTFCIVDTFMAFKNKNVSRIN